jgi:hypothetical protein
MGTLSMLHPDFVEPYVDSQVERWMPLDVVLPTQKSTRYFVWHRELNLGQTMDQLSQYGRARFTSTQLAQFFGECIPYGLAVQWHQDMDDPLNLFSKVKYDLDLLVKTAALTLESLRVDALLGQPEHADAANEGKIYKDCDTDGDYWVDGGGYPNIRNDIIDARTRLMDFGPANPNTMIVGPTVLGAMKKDIKNSEYEIVGPVGQSLIRNGQFPGVPANNWKAYQGTFMGLDVFVSNAVILDNKREPSGDTSLLLDNDVIICDRDSVGFMKEYKPFRMISDIDKITESIEYHGRMWVTPIIRRPNAIYLIKNAKQAS